MNTHEIEHSTRQVNEQHRELLASLWKAGFRREHYPPEDKERTFYQYDDGMLYFPYSDEPEKWRIQFYPSPKHQCTVSIPETTPLKALRELYARRSLPQSFARALRRALVPFREPVEEREASVRRILAEFSGKGVLSGTEYPPRRWALHVMGCTTQGDPADSALYGLEVFEPDPPVSPLMVSLVRGALLRMG